MRVLSATRTSVIDATADSSTQVVATGNLCVLRAFSANGAGPYTQTGSSVITFHNGDDTGPILLKYAVPYNGDYASGAFVYNLRSPVVLIGVPGIGIRFTDGMALKVDITGSFDTQVQVFYT